MSAFNLNVISRRARNVIAPLSPGSITSNEGESEDKVQRQRNPEGEAPTSRSEDERREKRQTLKDKQREFDLLKEEFRAIRKRTSRSEQPKLADNRRMLKNKRQEIFQLKRDLNVATEQQVSDASGTSNTGSLPDFLMIGAQKCGTTSLYRLLTHHPCVEPAATKELHFFDNLYDQGVEWYLKCFPLPKWKSGRMTVTGEATPGYIFRPHVPARVAEVVPQAKLIVLLRNPVDRAFSHYYHQVKLGNEPLTFREAVEAEKLRLHSELEHPERQHRIGADLGQSSYLSRGLYFDQLLRWSTFFNREQMLVLKSEDYFERPHAFLASILDFLALPEWEPRSWEIRNKGSYGREMDPDVRQQLNRFFTPYNLSLYEYLGVDFGW